MLCRDSVSPISPRQRGAAPHANVHCRVRLHRLQPEALPGPSTWGHRQSQQQSDNFQFRTDYKSSCLMDGLNFRKCCSRPCKSRLVVQDPTSHRPTSSPPAVWYSEVKQARRTETLITRHLAAPPERQSPATRWHNGAARVANLPAAPGQTMRPPLPYTASLPPPSPPSHFSNHRYCIICSSVIIFRVVLAYAAGLMKAAGHRLSVQMDTSGDRGTEGGGVVPTGDVTRPEAT